MLRAGTLRPLAFGLKMVAPVIMEFGTEEQKQKYLPDILQSNVWWCQGYSEPGSGSDLASLQTRAIPDGDDYIVNGSKIWTTMAQRADMIFCLVRTSTEGKRQQGITFLLMDMTTPGITVEPIVLLDQTEAPEQEVNQVFFADVRVPQANRIGKENDGWTVAKYLLEFERGNAYAGGLHGALARVREIARQERSDGARLLDDPAFAAKLAALEVTARAVEYTELRTLSALSAGQRVGASSSILKCQGSTMTQEVGELAVEATAYYANPFDRGVLDYGANVPPVGRITRSPPPGVISTSARRRSMAAPTKCSTKSSPSVFWVCSGMTVYLHALPKRRLSKKALAPGPISAAPSPPTP